MFKIKLTFEAAGMEEKYSSRQIAAFPLTRTNVEILCGGRWVLNFELNCWFEFREFRTSESRDRAERRIYRKGRRIGEGRDGARASAFQRRSPP